MKLGSFSLDSPVWAACKKIYYLHRPTGCETCGPRVRGCQMILIDKPYTLRNNRLRGFRARAREFSKFDSQSVKHSACRLGCWPSCSGWRSLFGQASISELLCGAHPHLARGKLAVTALRQRVKSWASSSRIRAAALHCGSTGVRAAPASSFSPS